MGAWCPPRRFRCGVRAGLCGRRQELVSQTNSGFPFAVRVPAGKWGRMESNHRPPSYQLGAHHLLSYDPIEERAGFEPALRGENPVDRISSAAPSTRLMPSLQLQLRAPRTGFEPAISALTGRRPLPTGPTGHERVIPCPRQASNLHSRKNQFLRLACLPNSTTRAWTLSDSNGPPPACKTGALPDELRALGANGRDRTVYLPFTRRAHIPSVLRWRALAATAKWLLRPRAFGSPRHL